MMSKKVILGIVALIIVAGFLCVFLNRRTNTAQVPVTNKNSSQNPIATPTSVPITTIDSAKLPERFPADIRLEAGADVTLNYNAINNSGMFQSSRQFVSKKSQAENFSLYQTSLKKTGWNIVSAITDAPNNRYIILATKDGNKLNILISKNSSGQVVISINNETRP